VASISRVAPIHLGLDVHKDTISVGILPADQQLPDVERITHHEASIRRLVGRLGDPRGLRACYEAGPTGFELARLLVSMGVGCQVIAPSLIPKAPGDKVKTDRRDCRRLARLHRAGELVGVRIPTVQQEALRDLCRTRADMSKTSPVPATGSGSSCCTTGGCGGAGRPGRSSTRRGLAPSGSMSPPRPRRSATTWPWSRSATPNWTRCRLTLPAGVTARRWTGRSLGWLPTVASRGWVR
jgi:hypothetical protein